MYRVLIENSGSADIWAEAWYVLCRSPPFLPLLSKKAADASCVLSLAAPYQRQGAGKHFLICPKVMMSLLSGRVSHALFEALDPESSYCVRPVALF